MKKIIYTLFLFLLTCSFANAETITFMDETYKLQNAKKVSAEYINKYISPSNKTIIVHYMPKEESGFDFINNFVSDINKNPKYNLTGFYPDKDTFSYEVLSEENGNNYIEYNVVKCAPAKKSGVMAIQFTKKYGYTDRESFLTAYDESIKENMKYISAIVKTEIPQIIKKKK